MFDLNEGIAKWRTALAESENCSKPDIDELEGHLREEIARRKDRQGELFCRAIEKPWGKPALFAGVLGIIAVRLAAQFLIPATVARLSVEQWGEMAIFRAYTELLWVVGLPLILLTVLILLRPSKVREAGTQS